MNITIHKDILEKIILGNEKTYNLFLLGLSRKVNYFTSKKNFDKTYEEKRYLPRFDEKLWGDRYGLLQKSIKYKLIDKEPPLYIDFSSRIKDPIMLATVRIALEFETNYIWTDETPPLTEITTFKFISSGEFEKLLSKIPKILPIKVDDSTQSGTQDYTDYGLKADFNWLEDNRLDPMYYERFLHFYGLRCLNNEKIYYLNPEDGQSLSLPDISQIDESENIWLIESIDSGYDNVYWISLYEVDKSIWKYYWQLFISEDYQGNFKWDGEAIVKDYKGYRKTREIHVVKTLSKKNLPQKQIKIGKYSKGSNIFTTKLGFSEFSFPEGTLEMLPDDAMNYLGIDLRKIKKNGRGLKIGTKIFGTSLIEFLNADYNNEEINKDYWKEWKEEIDFYFLEEK